MTDPVLQTQLLRLADAVPGFTEDRACRVSDDPREDVCRALVDLVHRGKLHASGGRFWRTRD